MATTHRKPATAFRCGNVNAAIWENPGEKGPFFSVSFSRPYKDAQGNWKVSSSYGLNVGCCRLQRHPVRCFADVCSRPT